METLHTITIAVPVVFAAFGAGIGQGLIGFKSLQAVDMQPHAAGEVARVSLIGMALTETSAILGLVISIMLLIDTSIPINLYCATLGKLGICCAIGITSLVVGITSSLPAQAACMAVARQPFFSNKILQIMLLTQSIIVTPNIFGFIIALSINAKTSTIDTVNGGLQLLAAGLVIGIGSIGPCIGLSLFAAAACTAIGVNRKSYNKILPFTFICEGIIETPAIFSLMISFLILNVDIINTDSYLQGFALIAAALAMGLSTIGTGISAGMVGSAACGHIGKAPDVYPVLANVVFLALAMIDTFAIYGFIIAIILIAM